MRVDDLRPKALDKGQKDSYLQDLEYFKKKQQEFKSRNCPGCEESQEFEFNYIVKDGFTYARCHICWSIFMNPGPTEAIISNFYNVSENYKFFAKFVYPLSRKKRKTTIHQHRATLVKRSIDEIRQNNLNPISILEVGAGDGSTLSLIEEQNLNIFATALEPNPASILSGREIHKNISFIQSNFEDFTKGKEGFDIITCFEVIEHLLNPEEFFKFVKINLKPNGYFIFTTPNAHSIEINSLKERSISVDIEHISLLSPLSIHILALRNNFKVKCIEAKGLLDMELIKDGQVGQNIFRGILAFALFKANFQKYIKMWNLSSNMSCVLKSTKP
jgi:2-polyprenyl-3-methyl-5-hydroxy-6-metoxy-1,4-benzoquinol methylase